MGLNNEQVSIKILEIIYTWKCCTFITIQFSLKYRYKRNILLNAVLNSQLLWLKARYYDKTFMIQGTIF